MGSNFAPILHHWQMGPKVATKQQVSRLVAGVVLKMANLAILEHRGVPPNGLLAVWWPYFGAILGWTKPLVFGTPNQGP